VRKFEVLRVSKSQWRSVGTDPQFEFSFGFFRPRFLLLYLEAGEEKLDPMLYFNRGDGFSEEDSVALPHDEATVFVISAAELPNVVGVRLDPASRPVAFNFWARSIYRGSTLNALASKIATTAVEAGRKPPRWVSIGEQYAISPATTKLGIAPNFRRHFDFVFQLAEVQLSTGAPTRERRADDPLISLVAPVFNTPPKFLNDLVRSFTSQDADDAELILVDDGSTRADTRKALARLAGVAGVKCVANGSNQGIAAATNNGLDYARGRWLGFVDHDDALAPMALKRIKQAFLQFPAAKFFYTDEVVTDDKLKPTGYILKPSFDDVLLSGVNYINHLSLYRRDVLSTVGKLRSGFEGSQDYDLLLRYVSQLATDEIIHVPYPAYLWRRSGSTFSAVNQDQSLRNARRALADHFRARGNDVPIEPALDSTLHRPRLDAALRQWPPVTVVIPSRNAYTLISKVLEGLRVRTDYPDLQIVVVDNGSDDARVLQLYESLRASDARFRAFVDPQHFNFSRQVNFGCRQAGPGHVLLLNNDVEIIEADWLREMVSCLAYPGAGIVGARLLYPDRTLQHAGVVVGLGGLAGHWFERKPHSHPGPFGRLRVRQSLSAVTAACMLISRPCLEEVGEFDESRFAVAYNDVDYCMRAATHGFRTIWTPNATLVHHESVSRGSDESPRNRERFSREKDALRDRHRTEEFIDPYFSPWYTRTHSNPGLALLSGLPSARSGRRYGRT
jgi:GT2 family glycosyltransferase